ncbi:MAG: hypothetical protein R3242_06105 [Akkermansiaceae bacterium]|nr:hypothetical protein [Akkermansiaceae bacterium]
MEILAIPIIACVLASGQAHATAQYPDIIFYKGEKHSLHDNPMDAYFDKHPEKKPKGGITSTALWRGYVASFEFKEKNLVLKDIKIQTWDRSSEESEWKSVRDQIVPANEDLIIDWHSGLLTLPHGELVEYVHMGYLSSYSNYILLEIENGVLMEERSFTLKEFNDFKKRQFAAFKKTEDYDKAVKEYMDQGVDPKEIDGYIERSILYYTDEFLVEPAKAQVDAPEAGK